MSEHKFIIVAGPSGVGKSTLIKRVAGSMKQEIARIISYTTRKKREDEIEGEDYFFISQEEFLKKKEQGHFIETACVYNDHYGTSRQQAESVWKSHKAVIKDLDIEGLKSVKKLYPQSLAVGIFVSDPGDVKKRIAERNTDFGENLNIRMEAYEKEVRELKQLCEVRIFNDNFDRAVFSLKKEIEKYLISS